MKGNNRDPPSGVECSAAVAGSKPGKTQRTVRKEGTMVLKWEPDENARERPYMLVRWEGGPPCCFTGTFEEVRKKAEEDPRTKQGKKYVIIK